MEGRSHALSGVVTGLALAPVLGYEHLVTASPLTQIVTGAAMVPDLDCGSSAASWQIGVAVAVGCAVHDLGDSITLAGCPMLWLLWPFPIKGETWYEIKPLGPLSFRTGGSVEHCLVFPLLLGATVWVGVPLAVPNAVPLLPEQVTSMALLLAVVVAVAVSTQRTVHHFRTRVLV